MTNEATLFIAEVLKRVKLEDDFEPAEIGKRIGFNKALSEMAARSLSDAGILVLGFDCKAHFSPEYLEMNKPAAKKPVPKKPRAKKAATLQASKVEQA